MASLSSASSCSKIESVKTWLESLDVNDFEDDDRSTALSSPHLDSWNEDQSLSEQEPMSFPKHRHKSDSNNNNHSGQEKGKKNKQDKNKPFYVPRKPHFFEHDLRNRDEDEEADVHKKRSTRKKDDCDSWAHDMYDPDLQKPKSKQEIIEYYGFDIRSEHMKFNEYNGQCKRSNRKQKKTYRRQENSTEQEYHEESFSEPSIDATRKTIPSPKSSPKITPHKPNHEYYSDLNLEQIIFNHPRSDDRNDKRCSSKSLTNLENKFSNGPNLEGLRSPEMNKVEESCRATNNIKSKPFNNYIPRFTGKHDKPKSTSLSREPSMIRDVKEIPRQFTERGRRDTFIKALNRDVTPEKNVCSINRQSIISSIPKVADSSKTDRDIFQSCSRRDSSASEKNKRLVRFSDSSLNDDHPGIDSLASVMGYSYYNNANGADENEDFIFPKAPDVSAAHLSPVIPQLHYFFANNQPHMFYQQGYEPLPMQWGYYTQSNCYQGNSSGVTIMKQHCVGSWSDPSQVNQVVMTSQHMDNNPYYSTPDEVETLNETNGVQYITSSFTNLSTTAPQTTHRYSLLRSKSNLNQLTK